MRRRGWSAARCRARRPPRPRPRISAGAGLSASAGPSACPSSRASRPGGAAPQSGTRTRALAKRTPHAPRSLLERLLDLLGLEQLQDVADLDVLVALEHNPALEAL